ncbi:ABC transporter substrate-binding protein [Hathewaya histolytica]|uniref:Iron compound ABC transporter substrate-binding protein n=1 Tax=Hathewaya histolytica TaxID=1498 RepID=A0A4V6KE14_HATHI|nr:ABC transporter substrate-binding protein [Hathewaya histolytica]VTQ92347.1 iron compound ABC transporter substrate-binding protein [Hathewaya histolytica]
MKFFNRFLYLLLCISITLSLASCGNYSNSNKKNTNETKIEEKASTYPKKIKDFSGKEITLEKEPQKVVSLAPSATETVFAIGKGNLLVGRTNYCKYPDEATKITSIGKLEQPNIEKILELQPDLVLASSLTKPEVIKKLENANIKVIGVLDSAMTFDDVYKNISNFGIALNAQTESDELIKNMKNKVNNLSNKLKNSKKPSVYYVISYGKSGDFTATGDTFISELISIASGNNIAKDSKGWNYSKEQLLAKDPDIIIVSKYMNTKKGFMNDPAYKSLKAVKENKVFEIDNNNLDIPGPRLTNGLEDLVRTIHPEIFK